MVATFLVVVFQTIPVAAYWDSSLKVERSINAGQFSISTAILTIITDVLVLAIPVYAFIGLKVNRATRIGVIFIFMTSGVFVDPSLNRQDAMMHSPLDSWAG